MNDRSKCIGRTGCGIGHEKCLIREACSRYTIPASDRQSWITMPQQKPCPMFAAVENAIMGGEVEG